MQLCTARVEKLTMQWGFGVLLLVSTFPLISVTLSGEGSGSEERTPDIGDMRLMGGRNEREGRVEVFLDGEWGTICGDLWEDTQTKVVCRQLNFFAEDQMVLTVAHNPEFFSGEGTGPVHMDSVLCNGDEPLLVNCSYSVKSDCSHSKDIGIVCPGNCTYGTVRLVGGRDNSEGRVEVCTGGLWGTVCDNHWETLEATVVCKQLDLQVAGPRPIGVGAAYFGAGRDPILMDAVHCQGSERNLTQCTHKLENSCTHSEDVGVICLRGKDNCTDSEIRLVGGSDEREGVVQVCYNGVWGAICDDFELPEDYGLNRWLIDIDESAEVICRQLGFLRPNKSAVVVRGHPLATSEGASEVPMLLQYTDLHCKGNEATLKDCRGSVFGKHSCSEPNGAVIACPGNCTEGDVRLVAGRDSREGIVEVCVVGHWISICRDQWSNREAKVVCRQLNYATSTSVALDGHYFDRPEKPPLLHYICSSNEDRIYECHYIFDQCDPIDSAGVICEVDCDDEKTRMLLENNDIGGMCKEPALQQASSSPPLVAVLAGTITPLVLAIILLVVIVIALFLKLRSSSKHMLKDDWRMSSFQGSNNTSKTDLTPVAFEPLSPREHFMQKSFPNPAQNQLSLPDTKNPEPSLPHLYESVRGQKRWLTSSQGSDLNILEEDERGAAAANCNDTTTFNGTGINTPHAYAILEPDEGVRCETADSLPSLLAPSSLDQDGSGDESAVSSAAAVLNFETDAPPLPPKMDAEELRSTEDKTPKKERSFANWPIEKSMYDSLEPRPGGSMQKQLSLQEERLTLSLKPTTKKTKSSGPQLKRLYSE